MKNVKNIVLGMVFLFGMSSMTNVKEIQAKPILTIEMDCNSAYTVCDNNARYTAKKYPQYVTYEIEYFIFLDCMVGNGC